MSDEPHETQELRIEQRERARRERELAESEPTDEGTAAHERRADKAAYLEEKLAERERSERDAE